MATKGRKRKPIAERFWPKVDRRGDSDCWPWIGTLGRHGYGRFYLPTRPRSSDRVRAHRVAYELRYGPIPEGLIVMHRCDNRACCNPAHLRLGTVADNNRDRSNKGRGRENRQWGAANPNAKLGEEDVRSVIAALQTGESQTSIAARFGIKQPQVSRIARREQWGHLWEEEMNESKEDEARRLSDHSRTDLPRIKVVSPYSASWTHEQEDDNGSH